MANIYRNIPIHGLAEILGEPSANCKTRSGKTLLATHAKFDDRPEEGKIRGTHPNALRDAAIYTYFARRQDLYVNQTLSREAAASNLDNAGWFGTPRVLSVNTDGWTGEPGQTIYVKVRDNARVAGVSVVIRDGDGKVLEAGEAAPSKTGSAWWKYTAKACIVKTSSLRLKATAWDLAGNCDALIIS